jgi:hypothetical protein
MAERGLCTGKINYGIHHTIAVVIKVRQNMSYLHDFTVPITICTKSFRHGGEIVYYIGKSGKKQVATVRGGS